MDLNRSKLRPNLILEDSVFKTRIKVVNVNYKIEVPGVVIENLTTKELSFWQCNSDINFYNYVIFNNYYDA